VDHQLVLQVEAIIHHALVELPEMYSALLGRVALTRSQDVIPTTQLAHRVAYLGAE